MIPADAGGNLDVIGRELGKAMIASGAVKDIRYENRGGAAGTIGLAQFVNTTKGDPSALMMGGSALMGGIVVNQSAVGLSDVTPVARLASDAGPTAWVGVFAAPGITHAQRDELIAAVEKATKSRQWQEWLRANGWKPYWLPGDAYGRFVESESQRPRQ